MTVSDEAIARHIAETFSDPEIKYVTFENAGDDWRMRRFTRVPDNAANPLAPKPISRGTKAMTSESPIQTDKLVERLEQIAKHDYRISFLAHIPDTAAEAKDEIERLTALLSQAREDEDELAKALEALVSDVCEFVHRGDEWAAVHIARGALRRQGKGR